MAPLCSVFGADRVMDFVVKLEGKVMLDMFLTIPIRNNGRQILFCMHISFS